MGRGRVEEGIHQPFCNKKQKKTKRVENHPSWRISELNKDHSMCQHYPPFLVVPKELTDPEVLSFPFFSHIILLLTLHYISWKQLLLFVQKVVFLLSLGSTLLPRPHSLDAGSPFFSYISFISPSYHSPSQSTRGGS